MMGAGAMMDKGKSFVVGGGSRKMSDRGLYKMRVF